MKKTLLIIMIIVGSLNAGDTDPVLTLDTGGHKGTIQDIIVTSDGRQLISASNDKTIRVWDTSTQQETEKILGQIRSGQIGKIYAIALSPDDRYLAVGGCLATHNDGDNVVSIKELDLYVTTRVKELTNGQQKPTTIIPGSIPDFPLVAP